MKTKIAFVLLAHEEPILLQPLIVSILSSGSDIFVHYDKSSSYDLKQETHSWSLDDYKGKIYFTDRIKIEWGEWSIVQASLNCLYLAEKLNYKCNYFALISGSCMPIKPISVLEGFLRESNVDYLEAIESAQEKWIISGIQDERWELYHYINWRKTPLLFSLAINYQRKMGIKRKLPNNLIPYIGSQWWCLRYSTIQIILKYIKAHKNILKFYQKTWVPDESFFQTLVCNLVDKKEICSSQLLKWSFNSLGVPKIYYNDSIAELMLEEKFFARKIYPDARELKKELSKIALMSESEYEDFMHTNKKDFIEKHNKEVIRLSEYKLNKWKQFAQYSSTDIDVIKRIPSKIFIFCSIRKYPKEKLQKNLKIQNALFFGDLFNENEIDFGNELDSYAGYNRYQYVLARQRWVYFIKDLVSYSKCKNLVFTMGKEAGKYLDVLKWSENIVIILVDEPQSPHIDNQMINEEINTEEKLYDIDSYQQNIKTKMQSRDCQFYQWSLAESEATPQNVIFLIPTCAKYSNRTEAVRSTWAKQLKKYGFRYLFLMGKPELQQPEIINDILYVPCKDDYESLLLKLVLGYEYLYQNMDFTYVYKIDDDCFPDLKKLVEGILPQLTNKQYIGGSTHPKGAKMSNNWHFGKCSDPKFDQPYKFNVAPFNFAKGGYGYFLHKDILPFLFKLKDEVRSELDRHFYSPEDVRIAEILEKHEILVHSLEKYSIVSASNYNDSEHYLVYDIQDSGLMKLIQTQRSEAEDALKNASYVEIKEDKNIVNFIVHPTTNDKKVAFYFYHEDKHIDTQWYSKNMSYNIDKKVYGKGKYKIRYFIVNENDKNPANSKNKEIGFSESITVSSNFNLLNIFRL